MVIKTAKVLMLLIGVLFHSGFIVAAGAHAAQSSSLADGIRTTKHRLAHVDKLLQRTYVGGGRLGSLTIFYFATTLSELYATIESVKSTGPEPR